MLRTARAARATSGGYLATVLSVCSGSTHKAHGMQRATRGGHASEGARCTNKKPLGHVRSCEAIHIGRSRVSVPGWRFTGRAAWRAFMRPRVFAFALAVVDFLPKQRNRNARRPVTCHRPTWVSLAFLCERFGIRAHGLLRASAQHSSALNARAGSGAGITLVLNPLMLNSTPCHG